MKEASVELDSRRRGRNDSDSDSESTETTTEAPTEVVAPVALASILEPYATNHLIYFIDLSPGS